MLAKDNLYLLGVPNFASYEPATALLEIPREGGEIRFHCIVEERLVRRKHPYSFPLHGIDYCLRAAGLQDLSEVDFIYSDYAREPRWLNSGPGYRKLEHDYLKLKLDYPQERIRLVNHHDAHAASAFYPSGFEEAAILVVDGLGSGLETQSLYYADSGGIHLIERGFDWGIGRLYSLITGAVLPYGPEKGYGKTMGLAPYGAAHPGPVLDFRAQDCGMQSDYSAFFTRYPVSRLVATGVRRCTDREQATSPYFARAAYDLQVECERQMLRMAEYAYEKTRSRNICLAGGVVLNGLANSRILERLPFEAMFCQPACSDMGVPFGAVLWGYFNDMAPKQKKTAHIVMRHAYGGRTYEKEEIDAVLKPHGITGHPAQPEEVAALLAEGKIVAWFDGGSEYGPRALGHRSILADPRSPQVKDRLNSTVKFREGYRPYAPSILAEEAHNWLELIGDSPFMLQVVPVRKDKQKLVPGITHVDGTTRPQTVEAAINPSYHRMISEFFRLTGVPLVLNTSFNINREPIVETVEDALICSLGTAIDYLYLQGILIDLTIYGKAEIPQKLLAERTRRLAETETRLAHKYCKEYSESERDLYLKEENLIADWHRSYRAKMLMDQAVQGWRQDGSRILIIGTRAHTKCLCLYISDFPHLTIAGFAPLDDRPGEQGDFSALPETALAAVDWNAIDAVLISTHEYQRDALALARKFAPPHLPIVTLYDAASDSLIYSLGEKWPVVNGDFAKAHGLTMSRAASVTASNIDFDYAPSRTSIVDRYALGLTYHWCHDPATAPLSGLHLVTPAAFEAQIKTLRQNFALVSATQLLDAKADLPETVAFITIDDGLKDTYHHMLPILKRWKVPAVVFCCSVPLAEQRILNVHKIHLLQAKLGVEGFRQKFQVLLSEANGRRSVKDGWEALEKLGIRIDALYPYDDAETREFKLHLNYLLPYSRLTSLLDRLFEAELGSQKDWVSRLYMTMDELKACQDAGLEIALHGASHPVLSRLSDAEQAWEFEHSLAMLRDNLGLKTLYFSYPYGGAGTWNNQSKRLLKQHDFESAFTLTRQIVKPDHLAHRWEIPRFSVSDIFAEDNSLKTDVITALSSAD